MIENTEGEQDPHDDANYHDDVENFFDLPVHRNIGVDQPEQHPTTISVTTREIRDICHLRYWRVFYFSCRDGIPGG